MCAKYGKALAKGEFPRGRLAPDSLVVQRFREGMEQSMDALERVRRALDELGVGRLHHARYMPFGSMLARFSRRYSSLTLAQLAAGLVSEWEMRLSRDGAEPQDRAVLEGICRLGFGIRLKAAERSQKEECTPVPAAEQGRRV